MKSASRWFHYADIRTSLLLYGERVFCGFSLLYKMFNHQYSDVVLKPGRTIKSFNLQEGK
jgi:hypothetical protein